MCDINNNIIINVTYNIISGFCGAVGPYKSDPVVCSGIGWG